MCAIHCSNAGHSPGNHLIHGPIPPHVYGVHCSMPHHSPQHTPPLCFLSITGGLKMTLSSSHPHVPVYNFYIALHTGPCTFLAYFHMVPRGPYTAACTLCSHRSGQHHQSLWNTGCCKCRCYGRGGVNQSPCLFTTAILSIHMRQLPIMHFFAP